MQTTTFQRSLRPLATMFILVVASLLAACSRSDISERPPVGGGTDAPPIGTQPSTVGALVVVPLAQAIAAVNTALPREYGQDWTNGQDACVDLGILGKPCVGTRYQYNASRGEIAIESVGTTGIKVSVEINLNGQGGFRGDLPALLKLDKKNFDAAARIDIALTPRIGADWCPTVDVVPTYTWTKNPRVEIVSRVNVDVSGKVNKVVQDKLPQIVAAVQASINCEQLKAQLASVYGKRTFPVDIAPGQKIHVNVEPLDFAFSGLNVDTQTIRLAALLTAKVDVSAIPLVPAALPLPPLKTIGAAAAPRINLAVPLRAPFALLEAQAQKLVGGKAFEGETAAGKVMATVHKVEVFPTTGGKIAIGIEFDAKLPGKILDTKGTVFLIGTPVAETKTLIRIKDASFTRSLDNDIWNALSALFDAKIRSELDKNLRYDFAGDVEKAKKALADKLADPTAIPNVSATVAEVDMGVGRVSVQGTDLVAEALFGANVTLAPKLP